MDRESQLENISQGSPWDDAHICQVLDLVHNEPDDLVRVYARLWLEHHSIALAQRVLDLGQSSRPG